MLTFEQWLSESDALNRIFDDPYADIRSLLNDAYKAGAATMLESCIILQENSERNKGRDRYITARVHSIRT